MRVGTNVWPGYEPLYLARELGYYSDAEVRLVEYSSATEVIHAWRNAAIDAAALTLDEVLRLAQDGHRPRVVAVLDVSNGADALLARRSITSLAALRGRRIGVENTAVGGYLLARALAAAGLSRREGGPAGRGSDRTAVPPDVGDGNDDDVVARQLREAAMKETGPAIREKLWQEYRDYKKGAGKGGS